MFPSSISQFQYNLSVGAQLQNDGLRQLRRRLSTNRSLPRMSSAMGDVLLALPLGSSNENGDRVLLSQNTPEWRRHVPPVTANYVIKREM